MELLVELSVTLTLKLTITPPPNKLELTMPPGVYMLGEITNHIRFLSSDLHICTLLSPVSVEKTPPLTIRELD